MDQNSQDIKKGDFVMLTREILKVLINKNLLKLTAEDKSIVLHILEQTIGQHCQFRGITNDEFAEATGSTDRGVRKSLKYLVGTGAVTKRKLPGVRTPQYGLNVEFFGRIYPGQIANVYFLDKFKTNRNNCSLSTGTTVPSKREQNGTFRVQNLNKNNNIGVANISNNISINISLSSECEKFLETRSQNTKKRWREILSEILRQQPGDESLLLLAIHRIESSKKDLFGAPIRASILGLFEKTDWPVMKSALLTILSREKEKADQEMSRKQQEELVAAARIRAETEVDVSTLSPQFKRYADPLKRSEMNLKTMTESKLRPEEIEAEKVRQLSAFRKANLQ